LLGGATLQGRSGVERIASVIEVPPYDSPATLGGVLGTIYTDYCTLSLTFASNLAFLILLYMVLKVAPVLSGVAVARALKSTPWGYSSSSSGRSNVETLGHRIGP
jgi:hypothetical protein